MKGEKRRNPVVIIGKSMMTDKNFNYEKKVREWFEELIRWFG